MGKQNQQCMSRMGAKPRVSVLMPAYNAAKYIAQSIESILKQTFVDFEFIIINDGSADNTADIIRQYAKRDRRIKFIDNKINSGLIAVLNQGLDLCSGEYIVRMDADDISLPHRLAVQVKYLDANTDVGVVGGWIRFFDQKDAVYKMPESVKLLDFVLHGCLVMHPTVMLRASVLRKHNLRYNPEFPYAEDFVMWLDFARVTKIHNIQDVLLKYRWHGANVSALYRDIQARNVARARRDVLQTMLGNIRDTDRLLNLTRELTQRFWLFGFLPIVRRKQYGLTKTKYYLFEKIPLIKEQDGKIYLFEFIKIGVLR